MKVKNEIIKEIGDTLNRLIPDDSIKVYLVHTTQSPLYNRNCGEINAFKKTYKEAVEEAKRTVSKDPDVITCVSKLLVKFEIKQPIKETIFETEI